MHHQVMDLQDEAVQPYEGGKGTIEEVHPDRTRRKNIIKPKKTSNDRVKLDHRHHYIIDHSLGWVNPGLTQDGGTILSCRLRLHDKLL